MPASNLPNSAFAWGVVLLVSLAAAGLDVRTGRIPNWLTVLTTVGGLGWSLRTGGLPGVGESLAAWWLMAAPYLLLFVVAGGGAGDAKLMGALGTWLGVGSGLVVLPAVLLAGAVMGTAYAVFRRRSAHVAANLSLFLLAALRAFGAGGGLTEARRTLPDPDAMLPIPYAPCVFAGVCAAAVVLRVWRPEVLR